MDFQDIVILTMELIGTVAFSASGAVLGADKGMDLFGICVLGVITSVGGGMIRDLMLGITPPNVFQHPIYVAVATGTACVVFWDMCRLRKQAQSKAPKAIERLMMAMDSLGLGVFTAVGVNTGIQHGYEGHIFLLTFLGTITGVGGGLLRDMMAESPPYIFVRHVYACASILGAVLCAELYKPFGVVAAMMISTTSVVIIRYLAAYYHWNLPKLPVLRSETLEEKKENVL